jgi:phenylalanyl-tRNA synthetase alpha chain
MKEKGTIHPVTDVIYRVNAIFGELGFVKVDGPEMETEYYNFDVLNVPKDHPARDMQDTFWLKRTETDDKGEHKMLLRTQTSAIQAHFMETNKPPFKMVCPGKVFRQEATDATHETQFYQFEGMMVDKNVTMGDLKSVLNYFFDKFFGKDVEVRFRPSYFPFVEPGTEIDISCFKCNHGEAGCPVCKGGGWVEVMGAGMIHPKVLQNGGINPKEFTGFAFGGSIERLAMYKYGIDDIRLLYSGDLRLVNQFETDPESKI